MKRHFLSLSIFFLTLLFAAPLAWADIEVPPSAYDSGIHEHGHAQTEVRLLTEYEQVRPGDEFRVGVLFRLEPDWHIYWENPGDAGLPTQISWGAEGLDIKDLQWSAPGVYPEADGTLTTFGYDGEVLLFSRAVVSDDATGSIELSADVEYLACRTSCLQDDHQLSRTITVGDEAVPADDEIRRLFDDYAMQVPQRADAVGIEAHAEKIDDESALLHIVLCEEETLDCPAMELVYEEVKYAFVTAAESEVLVDVAEITDHPTAHLGWTFELNLKKQHPIEPPQLSGVFRLDDGYGSLLPIHVTTALMDAPYGADEAGEVADGTSPLTPVDDKPLSLFFVLIFAFLGGLILNLMPCVFPVLAIKVASFTELVQKDRQSIFANAAAYTGGITASMLALGLAVVGLQLGGTQVGWGFQFQQPLFLVALTIIIVLFALNTFDLFQVSVGANSLAEKAESTTGARRSFAEGILAVVLATPCSAPFLGTAVGFALTANAATILLVFVVLGLGLASPFVVLTMIPGAARILPKPGAWMGHLKTFLGFALLAAAIWLVWLVGRLAGVDAMGRVLGFLGALSMATWLFGVVQYRAWDKVKAFTVALAITIVAVAATLTFPIDATPPQRGGEVAAVEEGEIHWLEWSHDAVDEQRDAGRAVFVDFTADWCLTCQANLRNAIDTESVRESIADNDVAMFKADWTHPDETIRAEIESYGKAGVPMYLFYGPGDSTPEVLPELLTQGMLIERFQAQ